MEKLAKASSISNISARFGISRGLRKDIIQRQYDNLHGNKQQETGTAFEVKRKADILINIQTNHRTLCVIRDPKLSRNRFPSWGYDRVGRTVTFGMLVSIEVVYAVLPDIFSGNSILLYLLASILRMRSRSSELPKFSYFPCF